MKFDFLEIIKKNLVAIIVGVCGLGWAYIQEGVKDDIYKMIDQRIEQKVQDSKLIETMLKSEQVSKFTDEAGQSIRNKIIEDVTAKDSNKINQNAYLG